MTRTTRSKGALAGLSLATLMASLGTSIANVALPTLTRAFDAPFQQAQWVVLAYLLATTTVLVGAGRLGDRLGRRRLLLAGIALFTAASALSGVAPTLWALIAARAAQGLGAALMLALAMALVAESVPAARTASAMGLLGTMSAIGTALGPSLGGLLIAGLGWRAIFLVTVPLGVTAMLLVHRHVPVDRGARTGAAFDHRGTLLLALALGAYTLAMTLGHFGALNAALLVAAGLFALARAGTRSPLRRALRLDPGLATSALVSTVLMTTLVVGPFHLTGALGLGPATVGLVMSIGPVVVALAGVPAGRLADRVGAQRTIVLGLGAIALGASALVVLPTTAIGYIAPIVVITAGYALFQTANNTTVMAASDPQERGATSGRLNLSRNLGLITGASVMGAVFSLAAGTGDLTAATSDSIAAATRITFVLAAALILTALAIATKPRDTSAFVALADTRG